MEGAGASGRLPILPEVWEDAKVRGVDLVTSEVCELLRSIGEGEAYAILHVTC